MSSRNLKHVARQVRQQQSGSLSPRAASTQRSSHHSNRNGVETGITKAANAINLQMCQELQQIRQPNLLIPSGPCASAASTYEASTDVLGQSSSLEMLSPEVPNAAITDKTIFRPVHQPVFIQVPRFSLPKNAPLPTHTTWVHGRTLRSYIHPIHMILTYDIDFGGEYIVPSAAGSVEICVAEIESPMTVEEEGLGDIREDGNFSSTNMSSDSEFDTLEEMLEAEGLEQCDDNEYVADFLPNSASSSCHRPPLEVLNICVTETPESSIGKENVRPCTVDGGASGGLQLAAASTHVHRGAPIVRRRAVQCQIRTMCRPTPTVQMESQRLCDSTQSTGQARTARRGRARTT